MADNINLTDSLKELESIAAWFDQQQDVDVEVGLTKVRQAAELIKKSKARLSEIENEFQTIEKEISDEDSDGKGEELAPSNQDRNEPIDLDDIPF